MRKKRVTVITESLNALNKNDIYSMMMFVLYKMKNDPQYAGLAELCYLLDGDNITKLLTYYGGMTITIPTLKDFRLIVKALTIYQYVNLEKEDFKEAIDAVSDAEFQEEELTTAYQKLLEVVKDYDFGREVKE